jgi:hypothetical protein
VETLRLIDFRDNCLPMSITVKNFVGLALRILSFFRMLLASCKINKEILLWSFDRKANILGGEVLIRF